MVMMILIAALVWSMDLVFYILVWSALPNGVRALREMLDIARELRQTPLSKEQVVDTKEYDA